jgi:hypothetical protein
LSDGQLHELKKLVLHKSKQDQWAWKEPRTCLFLDHYRVLLPDARYIVILRDYHSVVSSLISRMYNKTSVKYANKKGIGLFIWKYFKKPFRKEKLLKKYSEHYLQVWITYNKAILRHLQNLDTSQYLVVDHTALSSNNRQVFNHLSGEWDFKLEYHDYRKMYKESLQSDVLNISPYIRNASLLTKADTLQEKLRTITI